jgi:hypothetical protein
VKLEIELTEEEWELLLYALGMATGSAIVDKLPDLTERIGKLTAKILEAKTKG